MNEVSLARKTCAWGVHALTATGVVWCLLAIEASIAAQWRAALGWLLVGVLVDAADGTLARIVGVKAVLPGFDGAMLDNIVDFLNYVIVPAIIIHRAELLPPEFSLLGVAAMAMASAYQFSQSDAKTSDHYFKGFPSYWNIIALYLLALQLSPSANLAILTVLIVSVFVPVKYLYVTRTARYQNVTWALTAVWSVMAITILWQLPIPNRWLVWVSLLYFVYYIGLSIYVTLCPNTADIQRV